MTATAPDRILNVVREFDARKDRPKSYRLGGVAGDAKHSFGYHVDPADLPKGDYSLTTPRDRQGAKDHPHDASAWDQSYGPADMIVVTNRLLKAAKAKDPRMKAVREFCGTRNGTQTYPWDLYTNSSEGINTWDDSHLWHVHLSFYRDAVQAEVALVGDVVCGKPRSLFAVLKNKITPKSAWPFLKPGQVFARVGKGAHTGAGHGKDSLYVADIQRQLIAKSPATGPFYVGAVDGVYGTKTEAAVVAWQRFTGQKPTGRIDRAGWYRINHGGTAVKKKGKR